MSRVLSLHNLIQYPLQKGAHKKSSINAASYFNLLFSFTLSGRQNDATQEIIPYSLEPVTTLLYRAKGTLQM